MAMPAVQDSVKAFDTSIKLRLADDNFIQQECGIFYMDDDDDDRDDNFIPQTQNMGT
jgi:hypothetical protein